MLLALANASISCSCFSTANLGALMGCLLISPFAMWDRLYFIVPHFQLVSSPSVFWAEKGDDLRKITYVKQWFTICLPSLIITLRSDVVPHEALSRLISPRRIFCVAL